jgi:U3 small nucleolar RNA-associated protein 6
MLSKIYAEALQIHPRNSGLWIEAASHEYFGYSTVGNELETTRGGSVRNARVLLQRGLRVNQTCQDLWLQSFCLELHYIQKLRGRKEILKIGQDTSKHGTNDDGDKREIREEDKEEVQGEELDALIENAKLPRIIYKNAIKAIPRDVMFRVKFVEQCKLFPQTKFIVDEIMQSIEEDFGNVEEAWISRARIAVDFGMDSENRIGFMIEPEKNDDTKVKKRKRIDVDDSEMGPLQIIEEATYSIRSPKMFMEAIKFTKWYINVILEKEKDRHEISAETKHQLAQAGLFLKRIVDKARIGDIVSPELSIECTSALVHLGHPTDAVEYLERLMNENADCRSNVLCWLKYADVKAKVEDRPIVFCKIVRKALDSIPLHSAGHKMLLSQLFLNLLSISSTESTTFHDQELSLLFEKLILIDHQLQNNEDFGETVTLPSLCLAYMNYASHKGDTTLSRRICNRIIFSSNYTLLPDKSPREIGDMKSLFQQCIVVEKSIVEQKHEDRKRKLTRLFDAATDFFIRNGCDRIANDFTKMKNENLSDLSFNFCKSDI